MTLFDEAKVVGIFKGFSEGGLEFHADLVLPYRSDFQSMPMHGQFLIVKLENDDEAVLGRITSLAAEGRLSYGAGEDFGIRAISENRPIPEELREQYLKYQVNIRVLGVLRSNNGNVVFAPSHRRLPHVGSKVAFPSNELLREIALHNSPGVEMGWMALGEFIFSKGDSRLKIAEWMRVIEPCIMPKFDITNLISKRTFVFARAGYGKSNLIKLLFSKLYSGNPSVSKRDGRRVPVGAVLFDPDGEYFWPDDKGRPGLCDVTDLKDKIVVFTGREAPSKYYGSFRAGDIKMDIRRLRPSDVISIALSPEKQDQQNVRKLKGLPDSSWRQLVDEIYRNRNSADEVLLKNLLGLKDDQEAEMVAARANMTTIVSMLHDPSSQMIDMLFEALRDGKLCLIDVSQQRGDAALILSGLILQKIFEHNQLEFTKSMSNTIPTIMIVEEAQSVLTDSGTSSGEGPYVSWIKEGRKYDLGAVMITQQPGSIPWQYLSQGDNWFAFHLLSGGDLSNLKRANANFSDDLLSSLLNEPIIGNGVFWSSSSPRPYPIPIRVLSFEELYKPLDPQYNRDEMDCYSLRLRKKHKEQFAQLKRDVEAQDETISSKTEQTGPESGMDIMDVYLKRAISTIKKNNTLVQKLSTAGLPWKGLQVEIENTLPSTLNDNEKNDIAYSLVVSVVSALNESLHLNLTTEKRQSKSDPDRNTTWIVRGKGDEES